MTEDIKKNKKDIHSLCYLIRKNLTQSECIRLGIAFEKWLGDVIIDNSSLINIKNKNKKGIRERDHLFICHKRKKVYYAELKANINLDTEKSKSTISKCLEISEELKKEYIEYDIRWCLVGFRFLTYSDMPSNIQNKYENIKNNFFGINQYLKMLDVNLEFTEERYSMILNLISDTCFTTTHNS